MKVFSVSLQDLYGLQGGVLDCMVAQLPFDQPCDGWKRPAVVVIPGGGYEIVSRREGEPVAQAFLSRGFQTFILTYPCAPDGVHYPEQLLEAAVAVDYVRKNARALHVDPEAVFVMGFSAGGHLTGNLAVEYDQVSRLYGKALDCRPTAVGLCYPVIAPDAGHFGSFENLLSGMPQAQKEKYMAQLSLDTRVTAQTPPAFLWSTAEDTVVPSENALRYALALARNKIPYELHVYPQGEHGLSVCSREINASLDFLQKNSRWLDDCAAFFRLFTHIPY